MPRCFVLSAIFCLLVLTSLDTVSATNLDSSKSPPNVIVILVDDMGWSDIGCYGSEIKTPNIDQLAMNGIRFSQFYNTGRCSPTRAAIMTGHYPHQAGMGHLDNIVKPNHPGFQGKLNDSSVTIAEVLKEAGYFTAMTGKWHLGQQHGCPPWKRGFMRTLNLQAGGVHFYNQGGVKGDRAKLFLNGETKQIDDPMFGEWYGCDLWTDYGLKFISEAQTEKKPFFLYLAHCAPHFPIMAPEADVEKQKGKYWEGWDSLRTARYERQKAMGLIDQSWPLSPREDNTPAWDSISPDEQKRYDHMMSIYAAMISRIDKSIGTLIAGLEERKMLDNTVIFFLSDNGGNAESGIKGKYEGEHPGDKDSNVFVGQCWATLNNTPFRRWKHYVHEGGASTPLIVHWPQGISNNLHGKIINEPGHVIDLMTTIVDVAGAKYPTEFNGNKIEAMEGASLKPIFSEQKISRPAPIFFNHEDNRAVRLGDYKIVALKDKPWELYHIPTDRTELNNLAEKEPARVKEMAALYDDWAIRTRVVVDGENSSKPKKQPAQPKKKNQQNNKQKTESSAK